MKDKNSFGGVKSCVLNLFVFAFILFASVFTLLPNHVEAGWTEQTSSGLHSWDSIASSSDGTKLVAAFYVMDKNYLYTSTDGGVTWIEQPASGLHQWIRVASSADGLKLVAAEYSGGINNIHTSDDGGLTWTARTKDTVDGWTSISSSADGRLLAGTTFSMGGGNIFISTDSGLTWVKNVPAGNRRWSSIDFSADGTKLAATVQSFGYIYTSTDGGVTWVEQTASGQRYWSSIASSSDGTKLAATDGGNTDSYIYTSIDSGVTWTARTVAGSRNWSHIISSADGTKLAAIYINSPDKYIYVSNDSGVTWQIQLAAGSREWASLVSSSDGSKIAAGASGGFLYTYAPDNVAPTTTSIISGIPTEGKILTGSHIYNDIDNDIEGISTYRWLRDGIAIPSAILATYTTSKDDVGKTIVFEVTPIALTGTLIGLPVLSEGVVINKKSSSRGSSVVPIIINGIKTIPPLETISSEPTSTTSVRVDPSLTRTLKYKMTGGDVRALQVYLNTHNYPVALSGIGSLNNESTYFGAKTKQAVILFQKANGLVGDGIVGKMTRGMMK